MAKLKDLIQREKAAIIYVIDKVDLIPKELITLLENNGYTVFKIARHLNIKIFDALGITNTPTAMLYKNGQLQIKVAGDFETITESIAKN